MTERLPPWEQRIWERILSARDSGRLGHGLLFCGPSEAGQSALAARLAALLLCTRPIDGAACGACRSCHLQQAGTHADLRRITLLERDDGRLKTEIGVEQIRELSRWFALTPQFGQGQVAVIDPADRLNLSAANAVLKTLEEPAPGRYLLLVSEQLQRLPATVRSRCQRIEVRLPDAAQSLAWLREQGAGAQAEQVLALADGNPRRAVQLLSDGAVQQCEEVRADLDALAKGRSAPAAVARRWMAGNPDLRLAHAARLLRDAGRAQLSAAPPAGLTVKVDFHKLAAWSRQLDRTRALMPVPLRHELLLTELLQAWTSMARSQQAAG